MTLLKSLLAGHSKHVIVGCLYTYATLTVVTALTHIRDNYCGDNVVTHLRHEQFGKTA